MKNQRFNIKHDGIQYAYGLDVFWGYFFMVSNDDSDTLVTQQPGYGGRLVSRGVIMEKLTEIGAPEKHIRAIGSDLPFDDPHIDELL